MGARKAVLVGVGDYWPNSGLPNLRAPRKDVSELKRVLSKPHLCGFEVTDRYNPDSRSIARELEELFNSDERLELALFYFSGHGKLSPSGELHLCASDTEEKYLRATTVALSDLRKIIDDTRSAQVVIILDCCYSGAAHGSFKGDVSSILQSNLGKGNGKYLITSSTAIQPSMELDKYDTSLFTNWLVKGIEGEADLDSDGIVTIEELYRYVQAELEREFPQQRPQSWGFDVTPGDVVIARKPSTVQAAATVEPLYSDFYEAVQPLLESGRVIPFLGSGIYKSGPLSSFALAGALAKTAGVRMSDPDSLVTAAEYVERFEKDRDELLLRFRQILVEQTRQAERSTMHDFILEMKPPWLVISATYDMVLENRLEEAHQDYLLVAHILNSANSKHDGKILVMRRGASPSATICLADHLLLDETGDERIVYKVLGSPFLNDLQPEAEAGAALDTVVVTETDHMKFLGNLKNQHTKVPEAFSIPFRQRYLLFLGYNLDVWHYRLVGQVFGKGSIRSNKVRYAVRQPTSPIEELFWNRFEAELIRSDPDAFVRNIRTERLQAV